MRNRGIGSAIGSFPSGLVERPQVIGLGLLVVIALEFTPVARLRARLGPGAAPWAAATL